MIQWIIKSILLLLIVGVPSISDAGDKYVCDTAVCGQTPASPYESWATAADEISTAEGVVARGETIWVADGTYTGFTANVAVSGSTYITIKKASDFAHGASSGWNALWGDGQAELSSGITFASSYWLLDGVYRNSDWISGYGFKINHTGNGRGVNIVLPLTYIRVQYVEIEGSGPDEALYSNNSIYIDPQAGNACYNFYFGYLYLHDAGRTFFTVRRTSDTIIEYCYMKHNDSTDAQHAEGISWYETPVDRNIIRFNKFVDTEGTGIAVLGGNDGDPTHPATYNEFYGNVVWWTSDYGTDGSSWNYYTTNGSFTSWQDETQTYAKLYNNTIILPNSSSGAYACNILQYGANNVSYNNLYVKDGAIGATQISYTASTTHNWNAYSGGNSEGEANEQTDITTSYFVDFANKDFHLAINTTAGTDLGSPYNSDMDGVTRPALTWSRGAYQYTSGSSPSAPTALGVTLSGGTFQ